MKFDLHNLPFLAGGQNWPLPAQAPTASGLCPGLYFVKRLPDDPNTVVIDSTQGYNVQNPGPVTRPNPESKKYDNKNFVEWVVSQPNPCKYIEPCCIPVSQRKRYPDQDCCDGSEVVDYSAPVTGSVLLQDFLNQTFRCLNMCECNFNADRWNENQFQEYCASSPNQFVKSYLNTIFEEPCHDVHTQDVQGNITWGVSVQNASYDGKDGVVDSKILKSPDHWNYVCQNPKGLCLPFRTWTVTQREKESALKKYGNWSPPCLKCLSPVGTNVRNCNWCQEPAFTSWLGRGISNYFAGGAGVGGGRFMFKPIFWEDPSLLGYYGPKNQGPPLGYKYDEEEQHFACLNPEQTRHVYYDDYPEVMRCYVDSMNEARLQAYGYTASDVAYGPNEVPVQINGQWIYTQNVPAMVFRGQSQYGPVQANVSWVWQGLSSSSSWTMFRNHILPPNINFSWIDPYEWGYSEMCYNYGFFNLNHLFTPGICAGGDLDGGANGLGRAPLGAFAVADHLRVHNRYPDDVPDKKYTCRYHPSWDEHTYGAFGIADEDIKRDGAGRVLRFCTFGPDYSVESDNSVILGNWENKCKAEWEKAQIEKDIYGCEDNLGNPRGLGYQFDHWECVHNVLGPHPRGRLKPTDPKRLQHSIDLCGPCNGWTETTVSFAKAKGLYFVPMPPTGIHYENGCAYYTEDFDNYRLRYETKILELFPMPEFPRNTNTRECDDPSFLGDIFNVKNWALRDVETRTEVKMIYSGNLSDIISDHGTGVFWTGMKITDQENTNGRFGLSWNCEMPDFYEVKDKCNILDSIPQGADFYQITNSPCVEGTNGGKDTILHRGKTRLGPFVADSKIVVDYYKGNNYVAQSNFMSVKDEFMVIMPPPVKKTFIPHRVQSFHGMGHVFTHVSARRRSAINQAMREPYWFMKFMGEYHCVYDELYNGARIADLYYQYDDKQWEFNYGLCNILTGPST